MNSSILKLMFLIVGLFVTVNAVVYDFEVGGIYYNITSESDRKVSVTLRMNLEFLLHIVVLS